MKYLLALLLSLIAAGNCFAAVAATRVYEVRPTTGSNLNGGCYDSAFTGVGGSIDYTYTTPTVFSFTDLTAVASTTVTSASNPFTAAMVGNCIHFESGVEGTPGFFVITAFTSAGQVTIDTSVTWTTGVGKLGGATASISGQTTTTLGASLTLSNKVWIKNEAWNEAAVFSSGGSGGPAAIVEGYNLVRGDNPTGTSRPTNARAGAGAIGLSVTGNFLIFKNLVVSGAGTICWNIAGTAVTLINTRATACGAEGYKALTGGTVALLSCEADLNTTIGVNLAVGPAIVSGCYLHHNTTTGLTNSSTSSVTIARSIIARNTSFGIAITNVSQLALLNNTIDCNSSAASCGSSAVDGLNISSGNYVKIGSMMVGNIFSNNGRDGIRQVSVQADTVWTDYNNYFGNVGTARTNISAGPHDLALNPAFANAAAGDYAIGTALQAQGWPGLFPASTTTGYLDVGAVQQRGGGNVFNIFP